jgi:glutamate dehydrogenase
VADAVERFTAPVAAIAQLLPAALPPSYREDWDRTSERLRAEHVPEALCTLLANTRALGAGMDIAELSEQSGVELELAAEVYFQAGEELRMLWLYRAINELPTIGKWQALARVNLRDDAYLAHRRLAQRILLESGASAAARFEHWRARNERTAHLALARVAELQTSGARDFQSLAVNVRELQRLALI